MSNDIVRLLAMKMTYTYHFCIEFAYLGIGLGSIDNAEDTRRLDDILAPILTHLRRILEQ